MKKVIISFVLFLVCIFSVAYAGTLVKKVYFSSFPIFLNGNEYSSETPILNYQGRTYISLREFSKLVGVDIDFKNSAIYLGKDGYNILNDTNDIDTKNNEKLNNEKIVYISTSGGKYHYSDNCNNGTYYPIELNEAIINGYTACLKCVK